MPPAQLFLHPRKSQRTHCFVIWLTLNCFFGLGAYLTRKPGCKSTEDIIYREKSEYCCFYNDYYTYWFELAVVVVADIDHQCKVTTVATSSLSPSSDVFLRIVLYSLSSHRTLPWQHATRRTPHAAQLHRTVKPITTSYRSISSTSLLECYVPFKLSESSSLTERSLYRKERGKSYNSSS